MSDCNRPWRSEMQTHCFLHPAYNFMVLELKPSALLWLVPFNVSALVSCRPSSGGARRGKDTRRKETEAIRPSAAAACHLERLLTIHTRATAWILRPAPHPTSTYIQLQVQSSIFKTMLMISVWGRLAALAGMFQTITTNGISKNLSRKETELGRNTPGWIIRQLL